MKRRVIMVCSQMPPIYGGAGGQAALLGRTLARMGWMVRAVTLDQAGVGSSWDGGVGFHRVLRGVSPDHGWSRLATTITLGLAAVMRIILHRPSIVHVHGAYWWSIPPVIAGRVVGAKVVVKLTRDGEDDARTIYAKRLGPLRVGMIYGLSLSLAHAIIVLNEHALELAQSEGLGARTYLIPNGVDDVEMARSSSRRIESRVAYSLSDRDRVVLFVGYVVRHKGVVDLLEAWRLLNDKTTHLWLVGPIQGFYRELDADVPDLIDILKREGFRVTTFGHVPAAELPPLYWAADVFTLPSYAEGMPNSLAEALVAGCHIVATRIPGITELMGEDYPDLVMPGDVTALAERLAGALESPRKSPEEIVDRLRITNTAHRYSSLYAQLFESTSP